MVNTKKAAADVNYKSVEKTYGNNRATLTYISGNGRSRPEIKDSIIGKESNHNHLIVIIPHTCAINKFLP